MARIREQTTKNDITERRYIKSATHEAEQAVSKLEVNGTQTPKNN
jgi:hypothetical protein